MRHGYNYCCGRWRSYHWHVMLMRYSHSIWHAWIKFTALVRHPNLFLPSLFEFPARIIGFRMIPSWFASRLLIIFFILDMVFHFQEYYACLVCRPSWKRRPSSLAENDTVTKDTINSHLQWCKSIVGGEWQWVQFQSTCKALYSLEVFLFNKTIVDRWVAVTEGSAGFEMC